MERRTKEADDHERSRDSTAREPVPRDDCQDRPRVERHEPADERTLEEAGYGYGV